MKKREFKRKLKKESKALKKYYIYEIILTLLLAICVIPNIILVEKNMISINIIFINTLLIIIMSLPIIIIDIKNDLEIKKMYQSYIKNEKMPEYKDKTQILNVVLILNVALFIVGVCITIPNIYIATPNVSKVEDLSKIENTLIITTNKGNEIKTQYEKIDGFKIKIPTDFEIMSDEMINIKYPNGNPPSLVYTNNETTINVALVINDSFMENIQVEEYIKTMKSIYKKYAKDIKTNIWERSNHKIGEMEFIALGSDTEIYNHLIIFSVNDKIRIVNFNCTKDQMSEWQEIGNFIIDSVIFE